ncbi:glutamate 5-kinase [Aspergillus clavatus NRRL 1]|uniref:Glutamate 5-kinase, putative n=1 Tax=Aspergillus clavatus (strain ATCC 1007 / CBS 513.65 / DSM 816 / NCTC 3887 / NRRL 1 / QM 1276 / 107) TaxID=344612 RepID=A1CSI7_ASPCL|nr:glutamate 5-kinase, putative [Aspergillus clavatus NRRL 1]EAW06274.1 glutamate 5-kinase, putative [Aspergillus clavatus NRRL 1]
MTTQRLTIVIKLGTSSIVDENTHEPILSILTLIVETAAKLHRDGHNVVLVSSGAVGVGLQRMDVKERPTYLPRVQALAAVGQCRLMSLWDGLFSHLRLPVAQILLTRNDIADRTQYINAQNTFAQLFDMGVIPIVNENDTLAVSEIKFGDNDTLSAITAAMVKADYLFLMTDVDCLYTTNPRHDPDAQPIEVVADISSLEADVSSAGSSLGTGGMSTKIVAARLATSAGVSTIITKSSKPGNVLEIVKYLQQTQRNFTDGSSTTQAASTETQSPLSAPPLHTRFLPSDSPIQSRSFWLLHGLKPHGSLYIDHGAYNALLNKASLLPAGVVGVEGHFGQQEAVRLMVVERVSPDSLNGDFLHHGQEPREVGRALVSYGSAEIARIKGHRSTHIQSLLGYADSEYVALRENISFFRPDDSPRQ